MAESSSWRRRLRQFAAPVLLLAVSLALIGLVVFGIAERRATADARAAAEQAARAHLGRLASELQKFRLLPLVLAEYPDVATVLERRDAAAVARLNEKLELLARRTNAAVIYVIDHDGRTVAASNWRLATSFVGQNYGFRPYFRDALRSGAAELFALGTVSGRPGLFIARGVGRSGARTGVIVVKVEFDGVEAEWARAPGPTFVTDRNGVVIVTSRPAWRFRTTRPLDPAIQARVREAVQYGREPLRPLGLRGTDGVIAGSDLGASHVAASMRAPIDEGRLHFLEPLAAARRAARAAAWAAVLGFALLSILLLAFVLRAREQRLLREQARRALEEEVALRTAELRETNAQLAQESREREMADRNYRAAREELAQAGRLSSIGQIVAGVAHEINQPVAAIRSFADNGAKLIERQRPREAAENLNRISELTARIGAITAELRSFARRRPSAPRAVKLATILQGTLLLVGDRLRAAGVTLERKGDEGMKVLGDRVRLEQILINLLQNAADALEGRANPRVLVEMRPGPPCVIEVFDNGPGIPPDLVDQLFSPFATGRSEGLGLGLAIARDLARESGGDLTLVESPLGGAGFRLTLVAA